MNRCENHSFFQIETFSNNEKKTYAIRSGFDDFKLAKNLHLKLLMIATTGLIMIFTF